LARQITVKIWSVWLAVGFVVFWLFLNQILIISIRAPIAAATF
jgi:hypothetical protein